MAGAALDQGTSIDMINAQTDNTAAAHVSSPLTPAGSLQVEPATTSGTPGLPGAFDSTESRRWRVLEKLPDVSHNWRTIPDTIVNPIPPPTVVEHVSTSNEEMLIPITEDDNNGSDAGIAEFELNRASSPDNDELVGLTLDSELTNKHMEENRAIDTTNQSKPEDDDHIS
ncbi:hypothetical protein EDD18DRAFT_1349507 [Armillaria luteobubalina]|uniref:Uncharacterized protein n=1 Tax=Armillaria luteobubalina TaxID=153913 RepID=A0AA39QCH0_9AGAR|nr:hypothetical protein EDD18DRAFT_1349507 [Armillaria luteobubalina]